MALGVTVFGVLVLGTLIGVIASGVESRIDEMKRGRSAVVESDHLVVLGASSLLPVVVDQLLRANAGRRIAVVVMADRDPAELQDEVRETVESTRGNRLVFRYGDPTKVGDLELLRLGGVSIGDRAQRRRRHRRRRPCRPHRAGGRGSTRRASTASR